MTQRSCPWKRLARSLKVTQSRGKEEAILSSAMASALSLVEEEVLKMRYGLGSYRTPLSASAIASRLHIRAEHVDEMELDAKAKLTRVLQESGRVKVGKEEQLLEVVEKSELMIGRCYFPLLLQRPEFLNRDEKRRLADNRRILRRVLSVASRNLSVVLASPSLKT